MPIWDEEWRVRNSPACTDDIYCEEAKYIFTGLRAIGQPGFEEARARAKLAAAAPAMARLLLSLEWAGAYTTDTGGGDGEPMQPTCLTCEKERSHGHAPDCRWLAVMQAAGVRE